MSKFIARLVGETDGHTETREFTDLARAKAWLQRGGLAAFDDQLAHGEVSENGTLIWAASHLQTPEHAERDSKIEGKRFLTRLGLTDWRRR